VTAHTVVSAQFLSKDGSERMRDGMHGVIKNHSVWQLFVVEE